MTKKILALALGLVLALSGVASAQIATGNVYGVAKDESGALLPGVNATITSEFGTRSTVSGSDGAFRFLNLEKGDYTITLSLAGFASTVRKIKITTGENVQLELRDEGLGRRRDRRSPGRDAARRQQAPRHRHHDDERRALEDPERARPLGRPAGRPGRDGRPRQHRRQRERPAGDVLVEGPAERREHLEPGRHGHHRHVGHGRLADVLRLRRVPGDHGHDRRNRPVDGDGRRRHQHRRRGAARTPSTAARATWSPTRACRSATSTTRRRRRSSRTTSPPTRGCATPTAATATRATASRTSRTTASTSAARSSRTSCGSTAATASRTSSCAARPTRPTTRCCRPTTASSTGRPRATRWCRPSTSWAASRSSAARRAAASSEADSFLWNQDNAYTDGGLPGGLWKLQVDHTFSPNLFVSLKGMYYDTGFTLAPRGDLAQSYTHDSVASQAIGTYHDYLAVRPAEEPDRRRQLLLPGHGRQPRAEVRLLLPRHEDALRHGLQRQPARRLHQQRRRTWSRGSTAAPTSTTAGSTSTSTSATCSRRTASPSTSACATTARTRRTSRARRRPTRPSRICCPARSSRGSDGNLQDWKTLSPRVGLSYALDESRRTIVRASYSRYYQQLRVRRRHAREPDERRLHRVRLERRQRRPVRAAGRGRLQRLRYSSASTWPNPGSVSADTVNKIDRDRKPRSDDEFIVGLDRELGASFAAGVAFTYRKGNNWSDRPTASRAPAATRPTRPRTPAR